MAKKWVWLTINRNIGIPLEYSVVVVVPTIICVLVMAMSHDNLLLEELPDFVIPVVITVLISILMYLNKKNYVQDKLYMESRLKLLRSQFHPHFLFNMLNTVYFTIDEENEKARDTVENLSNLLRSQLYEGSGKVPLQRELSALNSYLELCRVRFGDFIDIRESMNICCGSIKIHPHLLLPLVENAVKHSGGELRRVDVRVVQESDSIELTVENSVTERKVSSDEESGLGLTNLRMMLELLYPKKYELHTQKTNYKFKANLKLKLQ